MEMNDAEHKFLIKYLKHFTFYPGQYKYFRNEIGATLYSDGDEFVSASLLNKFTNISDIKRYKEQILDLENLISVAEGKANAQTIKRTLNKGD